MAECESGLEWDAALAGGGVEVVDGMREGCPVARSGAGEWTLFRHADVLRVLLDHETFSNVVSARVSVPNGMDPPEHAAYRRIVEGYFRPEGMAAFAPACRGTAADVLGRVAGRGEWDAAAEFAHRFAAWSQCEFLGWPRVLGERLSVWAGRNQEATRRQDRLEMASIAREFEEMVVGILRERRAGGCVGDDVTSCLLRERVVGGPLADAELVSILRNWTMGEIGTIAAAVGILVHFLAERPSWQQRLRGEPARIPDAIEEILRLDGPLLTNRRVATRAVEIGGRRIEAGERLVLQWTAANRDGRVFADAGEFRLDRDQTANLLYGAGIHMCPGAPLARLELRVALEALLARTVSFAPDPERVAERALPPAAGFTTLPLRVRWRAGADGEEDKT